MKENNSQYKVSIIVPVYNAEKYLRECVNSLINQTYKNIEIILVNDGSSDNSLKICKEYEEHTNLRVITQENQGVSAARNKGLETSTGEYVMFVDSDDYIESNMVEEMIKKVIKSDMVICEYNEKYQNNIIPIKIRSDLNKIDAKEAILLTFDNAGGYLWNKIFKKETIIKNNFKFDSNIHMLEDQLFVIKYMSKISKITIIHKCLYNYRIRKTSAARNTNDKKYNSVIVALQKILDIFNELDIDNLIIKQKIIDYCYKDNNDLIVRNVNLVFNQDINEIYKELMKSKKIKRVNKIKIFIFKRCNWIYKLYKRNKDMKYKLYE